MSTTYVRGPETIGESALYIMLPDIDVPGKSGRVKNKLTFLYIKIKIFNFSKRSGYG